MEHVIDNYGYVIERPYTPSVTKKEQELDDHPERRNNEPSVPQTYSDGPEDGVLASEEDDVFPLHEAGVSSPVAAPFNPSAPSMPSPHPESNPHVSVVSPSGAQTIPPSPSSYIPLEPNVYIGESGNVGFPLSKPPRVVKPPSSIPGTVPPAAYPPSYVHPPLNVPLHPGPPPYVFLPHPPPPASMSVPAPRVLFSLPRFPLVQTTPSSVRPPILHSVLHGSPPVGYAVDPSYYMYVSENPQRVDATELGPFQQLARIHETLLVNTDQQRSLLELLHTALGVGESQPTDDDPCEDVIQS